MRRDAFRFVPPELELPEPVAWVVRWALGPPGQPEPPTDPPQVLLWARSLGLSARLAHRNGDEALAEILGQDAPRLAADRRRALVQAVRVDDLAAMVGELLDRQGIPGVLLKGAAMLQSGSTPAGSRPILDLDLLLPEQEAAGIADALRARGFSSAPRDETEHHLPALVHPDLGIIEIHVHVPGLRLGGERVSARSLIDAALCSASRIPGLCVPHPTFLRQHAIVHAVGQHSHSPSVYPLLRMTADLQDLRATSDAAPPAGSPPALQATSVSPREIEAVDSLATLLAEGSLPPAGSDDSALLRHAVAGAADPVYRRSLGIAAACRALLRGRWSKVARGLRTRRLTAAGEGVHRLTLSTRGRTSTLAVLRATLG